MERTYTLVDLWGAFVLRLGTGDYLDTWFLTAPVVLLMAVIYVRSARRLARVGDALDWTIRDEDDLRRVRRAIADHLRATGIRALAWLAGVALLLMCRSVFHLRFEVALSHVIALVLLPGPAILYGRRFIDRFRNLDVADPAARDAYEGWVTQWRGPHVALDPDEATAGGLSVPPDLDQGALSPR